MGKSYTLSVIIITMNEEERIETCLKSVAGIADEIIVLDSGSTDKTVEIIKKYTDQVFVTDWPGYGPQKQRVLEKASGSWVLSIDADESLSPELIEEIPKVLEKALMKLCSDFRGPRSCLGNVLIMAAAPVLYDVYSSVKAQGFPMPWFMKQ